MGLLSIIRKQKLKDHEIRVLILGLDNAGKSTIVSSLMGLDPRDVAPTTGFLIHTFPWKGFNINAWDIGGQLLLRGFWSNYFDRSDVIIWVIDGSNVDQLEESYKELREKVIQQDQLSGVYFVVLINKVDLMGHDEKTEVKRLVEESLQLSSEVPSDKYTIRTVSGMTREGLPEAVDWIIEKDVW